MSNRREEIIVDSFAGGGGASLGIAWAMGRSPDIAINHDAAALAMHAKNHPDTVHVQEDVWKADLRKLVGGRKVGLLWASPDCRHFSRAKGDAPVSPSIRSLAWVCVRWALQVRPRVIMLENVREFADWGPLLPAFQCAECGWRGTEGQAKLARTRRRCPRCNSVRLKQTDKWLVNPDKKGLTFRRWLGRLRNLGYAIQWKNLDAADFGAPTHRRRLFLIARCDGQPIEWPEHTHGNPLKLDNMPLFTKLQPWRTAAECIDWSIPCRSIFDRNTPLKENTLRRVAMGLKRYVLEAVQPFIVCCNHGGVVGHEMERPLGTITKVDHHALVMAYLARFSHGEKQWNGVSEPLCTVTSQGNKFGLVYAFLTKYYGTSIGQGLHDPLGTVTANQHFGLVLVRLESGEIEPAVVLDVPGIGLMAIADIGLRMLTPRELAKAQGFPDTYLLTGSIANQVARIGNSVCPIMPQRLIEANYISQMAHA